LAADVPEGHLYAGGRGVADVRVVVPAAFGRPAQELPDLHRVLADDPRAGGLERVADHADERAARNLADPRDARVRVHLHDGVRQPPQPPEAPRLGVGERDRNDADVNAGHPHGILLWRSGAAAAGVWRCPAIMPAALTGRACRPAAAASRWPPRHGPPRRR